jgi:endonuclease-8
VTGHRSAFGDHWSGGRGQSLITGCRLPLTWVGDLRAPTVCAVVTPEKVDQIWARLGPDPLRPGADPGLRLRRVSRSTKPITELLMDQAVLAGVGNVYRCEVLFRHRVDPFRPGKEIRPTTWLAIWDDLVRLMPPGVAFATWSSMVRTYAVAEVADGSAAAHTASLTGARPSDRFERRFYLYKRTGEPCEVCGSRIRTQLIRRAQPVLVWSLPAPPLMGASPLRPVTPAGCWC